MFCHNIIHYALISVDYLDYIKTCVIKANKSNYIVCVFSVFGVWCKLRILLSIVSRQVTTPGPDTRHQTPDTAGDGATSSCTRILIGRCWAGGAGQTCELCLASLLVREIFDQQFVSTFNQHHV